MGPVRLTQSLFDEHSSGEICTGIQKLSQRVAIEFLTEKGSMPYLPDRGTEFMTKLRQGRLRTELDVTLEFNFAIIDIAQNLITEEATYTDIPMPDDERFASAELTSIAILADFLQLTMLVTSVAGDSREVIMPISTLPIDVSV